MGPPARLSFECRRYLNYCQFNNANTAYDVYFVNLSCDEVEYTDSVQWQ